MRVAQASCVGALVASSVAYSSGCPRGGRGLQGQGDELMSIFSRNTCRADREEGALTVSVPHLVFEKWLAAALSCR